MIDQVKTELLIEASAVRCHQIGPFNVAQLWRVDQGFHQLPAQALSLQIFGDDHIPQHRTEDAVAAGACKTNQSLASPEAHHCGAAGKHVPECV